MSHPHLKCVSRKFQTGNLVVLLMIGLTMAGSQTQSVPVARAGSGPPWPARFFSKLVKLYLHAAPIARGKWWLRRKAAPWLVARLDTGPWIRVSGVAEFEWEAFMGARAKETQTSTLFRRLLRPGQVVVDVGANVGCYTLTAASHVGPSGRVIAFEPGPDAAARLQENANLNGFAQVVVVASAVADRPGTVALLVGDDSEGNSLFEVVPGARCRPVEVPVTTLDDFVAAARLPHVDVLKIDAEGAEVKVLRGARRILTAPGVTVVLAEANPVTLRAAGESIDSLRAEFQSLGYETTVVESMEWMGVTVENWLATKLNH